MVNLQYDPNRSANIALIEYEDGERRYILATVGLNVGDTVRVMETRPMSKMKRWRLIEVVERAK